MEYAVEELQGDNDQFSIKHAARSGAHDAVKMIVQYGSLGVIGAIILGIDPVKTVKRILT